MSRHASNGLRLRRWLALVTSVTACVGTPTPEPPDNLPTPESLPVPDAGSIFGAADATTVTVSTQVELAACSIAARAGAVPAGSAVWLVNLDAPQVEPLSVTASASGAFTVSVPARNGDRVRIVVRGPNSHSLPLDGQCVGNTGTLQLIALPAPVSRCLEVSPREQTSVLAEGSAGSASFTLSNQCQGPVTVSPRLRFGDQGVTLSSPSTTVPSGGEATLGVQLAGHSDDERAEIVLFDVRTEGQSARYVLGVWSVSASKLGND